MPRSPGKKTAQDRARALRRRAANTRFSDPWDADASLYVPIDNDREQPPYLPDFNESSEPESFLPQAQIIRTRSVFSGGVGQLLHQETLTRRKDDPASISGRNRISASSRLLDDVINHPMDMMYEDSQLGPRLQTPAQRWMLRIISFILCLVVGVVGTQAVRLLQNNTRAKVRTTLSNQITAADTRQKALSSQVSSLRQKLNKVTAQVNNFELSRNQRQDNFSDALTAVAGRGLKIVITNPFTGDGNRSGTKDNRIKTSGNKQALTDEQLQIIVSRLWAYQAEAISINGNRLGPQSSIRLAGSTLLIGTTSISSPYTIEAIGDANTLRAAIDKAHNPQFNSMLESNGITVSLTNVRYMTLAASTAVKVDYAKEK